MARLISSPSATSTRRLVDTLDPDTQAQKSRAAQRPQRILAPGISPIAAVFLSAYDSYRTLEEFAERLERSLRKLIERRIKTIWAMLQTSAATKIWLQRPFRGLEAYEFEHAADLFRSRRPGREGDGTAWRARRAPVPRFCWCRVRAPPANHHWSKPALMPRLMKPQRIQGAAFARRLVFRPSEGGDDRHSWTGYRGAHCANPAARRFRLCPNSSHRARTAADTRRSLARSPGAAAFFSRGRWSVTEAGAAMARFSPSNMPSSFSRSISWKNCSRSRLSALRSPASVHSASGRPCARRMRSGWSRRSAPTSGTALPKFPKSSRSAPAMDAST